ncbi:MAG: hypothetical protein KKE59_07345 [Proteobacteria bacterium]|nr:hypothetical protein [Pseudomonadota bacterium]
MSLKTLQQIKTEFPIHDWSEEELNELVSPKYGVITGFEEILNDIQEIAGQDLADIEPSGNIKTEEG